MDRGFLDACLKQGLDASAANLNRALFRLRKSGKLQSVPTLKRTEFRWEETDEYSFASEIAWRQIHDLTHASIDEILCDPQTAEQFDQIAMKFAPGYSSLQYRWAALKLRKVQNSAGTRSDGLPKIQLPKSWVSGDPAKLKRLHGEPGLYMIYAADDSALYAGETFDLGNRLEKQFGPAASSGWTEFGPKLKISAVPYKSFEKSTIHVAGSAWEPGWWLISTNS